MTFDTSAKTYLVNSKAGAASCGTTGFSADSLDGTPRQIDDTSTHHHRSDCGAGVRAARHRVDDFGDHPHQHTRRRPHRLRRGNGTGQCPVVAVFRSSKRLVAILIGVIVVLGLGGLSERLIHHRTTTDSNSAAMSLAERQLEKLFADQWRS